MSRHMADEGLSTSNQYSCDTLCDLVSLFVQFKEHEKHP